MQSLTGRRTTKSSNNLARKVIWSRYCSSQVLSLRAEIYSLSYCSRDSIYLVHMKKAASLRMCSFGTLTMAFVPFHCHSPLPSSKSHSVLFTAFTNHIGRRGRNQEAHHKTVRNCLPKHPRASYKHVYRHEHRTSSRHPHARAAPLVHRLAHTHPPLSNRRCVLWLPVLQIQEERSH